MSFIQLAYDFRLTLAVVLLIAGVTKLVRSSTQSLDLLHAAGVSVTIPTFSPRVLGLVEIGLSVWLMTAWQITTGLLATAVLLTCFAVVMLRALRRGYVGSCGCFGSSSNERRLSVLDVAFDAVLLVAALFGIIMEATYNALPPRSIVGIKMGNVTDIVMLMVGGAAIFALLRRVEIMGKPWGTNAARQHSSRH